MVIKRLQKNDVSRFPRIGKLRKGSKRPASGKTPGKDLTYFRFDTEDDRAADMFTAHYGDEPDTINVYLPFTDTDQNFQAWQEAWIAGGLQHRCDGETCVIWLDTKTGAYSQEPKPCPGGCKPVGRLTVLIPELQRFAAVEVETHSIHDIITFDDNLRAIGAIAGKLDGIPFVLKRRPRMISTPSGQNGKRARREKWLLSIEVDPVWASIKLDAMRRNLLADVSANTDAIDMPLLEVADDDSDDLAGLWDEAEPQSQDGPAEKPPVPDELRKQFHAIGKQLYGDGWDTKRHELVESITTGESTSSNDLTEAEMRKLVAGMKAKQAKAEQPDAKARARAGVA